ncbi:MAG TPA: hypothetical protein VGE27_14845 [Gemmatimonas sp.]
MTLLWPLLGGQILFGGGRSDMFIAGYSFRLFGAETFLQTGHIPQWNPYLFGGLPYIGAMHGDIFYPTAWLRWIMPVDLAITFGMAVHFVLAGWFTYRFARALGLTFSAALLAGVAYELTGIVASQMSPGHDGKLFVSALTPLAFWVLLRAIREEQRWAFGAFALVVALSVLGHYHMAYFLLLALGLWALYLACWDPQRPQGVPAWRPLGWSLLAVVVGFGITALQVMPFLAYIPFSPRADGGPDTGWQFATSYALPPSEVLSLVLPQFHGVLDRYWGSNPIKFHTEYLGVLPVALAVLAFGERKQRRLVIALVTGALLFLILSFGGHTPIYRLFYELLPLIKKIRAMGMVFYLPAFFLCLLAGIGADRLLAKQVSMRSALACVGGIAVVAALGAMGALQGLAESLALTERAGEVVANAEELRSGSWRLLGFALASTAVLWGIVSGRLTRSTALAALVVVLTADLWSIDRAFYRFSPRAKTLFADDAITTELRRAAAPYRVLDAGDSYGWSLLMAYGVPVARGYHGFSLQRYNELGGAAEGWRNLYSPTVLDLLAVRYLILPDTQDVSGFRKTVGPITTTFGTPAVLYERESPPPYARVVSAIAKLPESQIVPTLVDPRFPVRELALLPDTSTTTVPVATTAPFPAPVVTAQVTAWSPGEMRITLSGQETTTSQLVVSENWFPDWHAEVDGKAITVRRADHTLLAVDIPPGATTVRLWFESAAYARGKIVSLIALLTAIGMIALPVFTARRRAVPRT